MRNILVGVMALAILLGGCSKKKVDEDLIDNALKAAEAPAKVEKQEPVAITVVDDDGEDYSFPTKIFFEFGKSHITPDMLPVLDILARTLMDKDLNVIIYGATCPIGTYEYNLHLGQARALAIQNDLVTRGVDPDRIAAESWGEEESHLETTDVEMLWKNRRGECYMKRDNE